jgi:VIT1/CCC1 family predicted Fe2+/Mn2+ transporter
MDSFSRLPGVRHPDGLFFIIGALPILLLFFAGQAWDSDPWIPAIAAFFLAILTLSGAGFFVAALSAKKILVKIAHSRVIGGTCRSRVCAPTSRKISAL